MDNEKAKTPISAWILICLFSLIFIGFGVRFIVNQSLRLFQPEAKTQAAPAPDTPVSEIEDLLDAIVTAYCPCSLCCGKFADGITASGHIIQKGDRFVAAPPEIPFGTMLIIEGYNDGKSVPVLDRGGAIKSNRIDVFFNDHNTALRWGVKNIPIKLQEIEY